jgi:RIO-like serine/threonine protein kinase
MKRIVNGMSEDRPLAQLERLFGNTTARVLDHLIIYEEFEYSREELMKINEIDEKELDQILDKLSNWKLITITSIRDGSKYKLTKNDVSFALKKLEFYMATEGMN